VCLQEDPDYPVIVLNYIVDPIVEGEESMFKALKNTMAGKVAPLEPSEWAARILKAVDLPDNPEASALLAGRCRASYALQRFLWKQAAKKYNPEKHPGDLDGPAAPALSRPPTRIFRHMREATPEAW